MTGQRKPYNPNTTYGRRKLREQWLRNLGNPASPNNTDPQSSNDGCSDAWGVIIVIILGLLVAWAKHAVK